MGPQACEIPSPPRGDSERPRGGRSCLRWEPHLEVRDPESPRFLGFLTMAALARDLVAVVLSRMFLGSPSEGDAASLRARWRRARRAAGLGSTNRGRRREPGI